MQLQKEPNDSGGKSGGDRKDKKVLNNQQSNIDRMKIRRM